METQKGVNQTLVKQVFVTVGMTEVLFPAMQRQSFAESNKDSLPSVSKGNWFQDSFRYQNSQILKSCYRTTSQNSGSCAWCASSRKPEDTSVWRESFIGFGQSERREGSLKSVLPKKTRWSFYTVRSRGGRVSRNQGQVCFFSQR